MCSPLPPPLPLQAANPDDIAAAFLAENDATTLAEAAAADSVADAAAATATATDSVADVVSFEAPTAETADAAAVAVAASAPATVEDLETQMNAHVASLEQEASEMEDNILRLISTVTSMANRVQERKEGPE